MVTLSQVTDELLPRPKFSVCGKQLAGDIDQSELLLKLNAGELNQAVVISGPNPMPRPDIPNHFIGRFALIGDVGRLAGARAAAESNRKLAVFGAFSLYLNFINIFQLLLNFTGEREE
jgi:hypothetical protein